MPQQRGDEKGIDGLGDGRGMSVKRYEFELYHCNGGEMLVSDTGDYVSYDDYAELEARCAALAAELKAAVLDEIEAINRGGQAYCVKDGMSVNPIYARGWNDYRAKALSVETPATDAFLAEVRAQGIDQWIASRNGRWNGTTAEAERFAAQLRKGVQS